MKLVTDERLAERAKTGDEAAFEVLLARYRRMAHALAARVFAPGWDRDDLVQEAELAVWSAVRSYDQARGVPFGALAFIVVRRRLVTAIRAANCAKHGPLNDALRFEHTYPGETVDFPLVGALADHGATDPVRALELKEQLAIVVRVLTQELSPRQRRVAVAFMNGAEYLEIAATLGLSHTDRRDGRTRSKAVDNALQLTRKKVLRALEEAA